LPAKCYWNWPVYVKFLIGYKSWPRRPIWLGDEACALFDIEQNSAAILPSSAFSVARLSALLAWLHGS
jgi:hypothetical protein